MNNREKKQEAEQQSRKNVRLGKRRETQKPGRASGVYHPITMRMTDHTELFVKYEFSKATTRRSSQNQILFVGNAFLTSFMEPDPQRG